MFNNFYKTIGKIVLFIFVTLFCVFAIKGNWVSYRYQDDKSTSLAGPFESSSNSSRYALTESIVVNRSFFLTDELAKFSSPDLTRIGEKFITIFTPGVSMLGVPFYKIGQYYNAPQISTFLLSTIVSIANMYLIAHIVVKFGISSWVGLASGIIFLFGTNAYSYSNSFGQHHISTALLLITIILSKTRLGVVQNILFGSVIGLGLLVDIPNGFLMLPAIILFIYRNFITIEDDKNIEIQFNGSALWILVGIVPFILLFGHYNKIVTGSYFKLGQTSGRYIYSNSTISEVTKKVAEKDRSDFHQFYPRRILDGIIVLLASHDRGIFKYSPILILGLLGLFSKRVKKGDHFIKLLVSTMMINLLLYSLFNDPWGGWSFGSRYLIPTNAIMSILIGFAIDRYSKKIYFGLLIGVLFYYSAYINSLGAITTQIVPSSIQVPYLSEKIDDDYKYNISLLNENTSSSLVYNTILNNFITARNFHLILTGSIFATFLMVYLLGMLQEKNNEKHHD